MASQKHLVEQHLENISWEILERYPEIINNFIKAKAGIYALYSKDKLYYIGLASNLKQRLKIHLKDRHKGLWERFSVYLTVHDEHMKELESLLLKIIKPKGNKAGGSFISSKNLKSELDKTIKEIDNSRRAELVGKTKRVKKKIVIKEKKIGSKFLAGLFTDDIEIIARHRKIEYKGILTKEGKIIYNGIIYNSPSSSATAITGRSVDGWHYWRYKDEKGNWVKLDELRN
jgi:predicted GIY-YIG superfamily endonuclease